MKKLLFRVFDRVFEIFLEWLIAKLEKETQEEPKTTTTKKSTAKSKKTQQEDESILPTEKEIDEKINKMRNFKNLKK